MQWLEVKDTDNEKTRQKKKKLQKSLKSKMRFQKLDQATKQRQESWLNFKKGKGSKKKVCNLSPSVNDFREVESSSRSASIVPHWSLHWPPIVAVAAIFFYCGGSKKNQALVIMRPFQQKSVQLTHAVSCSCLHDLEEQCRAHTSLCMPSDRGCSVLA